MESQGLATTKRIPKSKTLAMIAVFSALIAVGTVFSIPLPPPIFEITWAPPIYLTLAVLVDSVTAFDATAIGGFVGEAVNVAFRGGFPIYPFGMVWARGPEVFIVAWAKRRGTRWLIAAMVGATVFETAAFFFPDWAFYSLGVFYGSGSTGLWPGLAAAWTDLLTLLDLAFIPVALILIRAAKPTFRRLGYE